MNKFRISFPRLGRLLQNDLLMFARPVLLATGIMAGVLIAAYMIQIQDLLENDVVPPFFNEWFGTMLMIGGFVFSGFAFYELSHKEKGMSFLLIPASQLEKWLSRFLLTSVVYAVYFWVAFGLIGLVAQGISQMIFGVQLHPFEWAGETTWFLIRIYLVLQSLFLAGSVFLGKLSFLKTPVVLGIAGGILLVITYVYVRVLIWDISEPGWGLEPEEGYRNSVEFRTFADTTIVSVLDFFFFWVLAPFFWVVSYVRLTEKEV